MAKKQQQVLPYHGTDFCETHAERYGIGELFAVARRFPAQVINVVHTGTCDMCTEVYTPEMAWQQVTILAGMYVCHYDMPDERDADLSKQARHQMYRILGAAGVKCSEQDTKDKVWAILEEALLLEHNWQADDAYQLDAGRW